jgi:hypothetical protein
LLSAATRHVYCDDQACLLNQRERGTFRSEESDLGVSQWREGVGTKEIREMFSFKTARTEGVGAKDMRKSVLGIQFLTLCKAHKMGKKC